jgi:hypothetical protein
MAESDRIKKEVDWLKIDTNLKHDYQVMKMGKNVLNLPKHQIYNTHHGTVKDYFINPTNSYSSNPFNSISSFYVDFTVPKINSTFYQFVLRYNLKNTSSKSATCAPGPLQISKVSILKNSNAMGIDVDSNDIFYFNMYKYYQNLYPYDIITDLGVDFFNDATKLYFNGLVYLTGYDWTYKIELPISLNRSDILASSIKDDLVIRVYFKPDIVYNTDIASTVMTMSNCQLVLRVHEQNQSQLAHLYKQPKFNHFFNKRIVQRYNIVGSFTSGQEISIPLSGFRNICSAMLVYVTDNPNNIKSSDLNYPSHLLGCAIDNVYIVNPCGQNINNNYKQDWQWNQYLMSQHFGRANQVFDRMCPTYLVNGGGIFFIPFCSDHSDSYFGSYSGGFSFNENGDHILKFCPRGTSTSTNLVLNVIFFVPALLTVENGELKEELA